MTLPPQDEPARFCLDAAVSIRGLSDAQRAWLERHWLHPRPAGGVRRRLVISGDAPPPPPPEQPPQTVALDAGTVQVWTQGQQVWLDAGSLWLDVSGPAQATVQASAQATSEAAWWLALAEAHRAAGWVPLHAALVGEGSVNGRSVDRRGVGEADRGRGGAAAISGRSGAGKSTAALRLMGEGYRLLAEDQTWVRGADLCAVGLDHCLRAYPDSVARFAPHLLAGAEGQDIHGKLMLPGLQPGQMSTLRQILLLADAGGPAVCLDRAAQVRALWEASGVPLTDTGRQAAAQAISGLLARVLVTGASRSTVLAQVAAALSVPPDGASAPAGG